MDIVCSLAVIVKDKIGGRYSTVVTLGPIFPNFANSWPAFIPSNNIKGSLLLLRNIFCVNPTVFRLPVPVQSAFQSTLFRDWIQYDTCIYLNVYNPTILVVFWHWCLLCRKFPYLIYSTYEYTVCTITFLMYAIKI